MMNPTFDYMLANNMINTNTETTDVKEESKMMDKFNRIDYNATKTNIANNKLDVVLERFTNLKGTAVEALIRTLVNIMEEADRHIAIGDAYFDYLEDRVTAQVRINMLVSKVYQKEGNIELIEKDFCFKNSKTEALELSDHYWAINNNN